MSFHRSSLGLVLVLLAGLVRSAPAQVGKGHQILIDRGLQVQGLAQDDCYVTLQTYTNLNYNSVCWINNVDGNGAPLHSSRNPWLGDPPGFLWSRWVADETQMPPHMTPYAGDETPYLGQLFALCLADEWDLNNATVRTRLVDWFAAVRANWPNAILYHNNWGSQIADGNLADFYTRAQPDMLCFDTYPWNSVWDANQPEHIGPPLGGPPTAFYGDLRRYREHARGAGVPLGIYRQTFHAVQDYNTMVYRDPSRSEIRLNTFAAMAFSAKFFNDFLYNTGAASLFTKTFNGSGDTVISTNGLYAELADVNRRARSFGQALVRLTPLMTEGFPGYTTSMLFLRGRDGAGNLTPIPIGFLGDLDSGGGNAAYTDWVYQRNDPYLTNNWTVTNLGSKNNGQPGDVILAWFKPLDESFDGPDYTNESYLMVVNGLSWTNGTAADCRQRIELNFHSSLAGVELFNPLSGVAELRLLPLTNGLRRLTLELDGGDAALFKFSDGAPFVGTQLAPVTGAPVITLHPAGRTSLLGTEAAFAVRAAGSAPLSYQWQRNGVDLPSATTNCFTLAHVEAGDAGSYTAIVSNAFDVVTSTPAVLTVIESIVYEPFDYSNLGGPVSANTPANWVVGGSGADDFSLVAGNLSYAGLRASAGNSATNGGAGLGLRRLFGTTFTGGKVYCSVLFRMNALGYGGGGWNGAATTVAALTATNNTNFRLAVQVKATSASAYVFGVQKSGGTTVFDTTEYHAGDTVFLVGQYDFTASPDTVTLWLNPSAATFGALQPPAGGFISASTGTEDTTAMDRFNFRQNTVSSVPAAMQWDELRIGTTWAEVTPRAVALPPQITAQPTNQTVAVGAGASFSVGATGTEPLRYQWRFNGTTLAEASNSVYLRANAQRYHAGNYSVLVTNTAGSVTSSNATLQVTPVLPVTLHSASNLAGGCFVFQGSGDPGEFAVEASTNLTQWSAVASRFSLSGAFEFTDALTNAPARFFRVRLVP